MCPQCVWNEVQAGLIEAHTRSIALTALVISLLSKFCSFAGPLQFCSVAKVPESCSHQILGCFLFSGNSYTGKSVSMWRFLKCKASFGGTGMHAGVEASEGAKDWHVMAEPSLWRCSAETYFPVQQPATWDRNTHMAGGDGFRNHLLWQQQLIPFYL